MLCNRLLADPVKFKCATAYVTGHVNHRWKSSATSQDEYQYIHRSKLPTMCFQASLPRLPVPELEKTAERYLSAQKPLLSNADFDRTTKYVKEFQDGIGKTLNEELKAWDKNNKHTNYVSGMWFDMYLRDRVPIPINYNPVLVYVNDQRTEYNQQLIRATNMLISSVRFAKALEANVLEPEVFHMNPVKTDTPLFRTVTGLLPSPVKWHGSYLFFKAFPLDMSQYPNLFNSTRIPGVDKDQIVQDKSGRHVLIIKKGNFYTFDVMDQSGNILPPSDILACMNYIANDPTPQPSHPLGVLTTEERNTWASARKHLEGLGNAEALQKIDSALFNLALDDATPGTDPEKLIRNFLHGDGINRWFDKSFSLIFAKDGWSGINFEHAWGDGVAVLRYFKDIYDDSSRTPRIHPDTKPSNCSPENLVRRLEFKLDDKMKELIENAKRKYDEVCSSLNVHTLESNILGKKICKECNVSPDAVMQLGFQVAIHKQLGKQVATYESCSTAGFLHGRTETMRPCTMATKEFCETLHKTGRNPPSTSELMALIKKCSDVHSKLTREAAMGQGFDRHLFALRHYSEKHGGGLPQMFQDPAYAGINHNIVSTSTLGTDIVAAGGFGPVVKDGYGVGYSVLDNRIGSVVTSYASHRNGSDFVDCLRRSYEELYNILVKSKQQG